MSKKRGRNFAFVGFAKLRIGAMTTDSFENTNLFMRLATFFVPLITQATDHEVVQMQPVLTERSICRTSRSFMPDNKQSHFANERHIMGHEYTTTKTTHTTKFAAFARNHKTNSPPVHTRHCTLLWKHYITSPTTQSLDHNHTITNHSITQSLNHQSHHHHHQPHHHHHQYTITITNHTTTQSHHHSPITPSLTNHTITSPSYSITQSLHHQCTSRSPAPAVSLSTPWAARRPRVTFK